jgi:hypothetical protein
VRGEGCKIPPPPFIIDSENVVLESANCFLIYRKIVRDEQMFEWLGNKNYDK